MKKTAKGPTSPTANDWARLFGPAKDSAPRMTSADLARVFGSRSGIKKKAIRHVSYTPADEDA